MSPVRLRAAAVAMPLAVLTACTSSAGGSRSGDTGSAPGAGRPASTGATSAATGANPTSGGATGTGRPSSTTPTISTGVPTSAAPARPVPGKPLRTVTVQGVHSSYVLKVWAEVKSPTCADHAYGAAVVAYLRKHPCRGLTRQLGTTAVNGRAVGFARSVLGFAGAAPGNYRTAGDFQTLVAKDGTGNLADLLRAGYRLPSGPTRVPGVDAFTVQGQDGGVVVLDAWYLSGSTPKNDPPLTQLGEETFGGF